MKGMGFGGTSGTMIDSSEGDIEKVQGIFEQQSSLRLHDTSASRRKSIKMVPCDVLAARKKVRSAATVEEKKGRSKGGEEGNEGLENKSCHGLTNEEER